MARNEKQILTAAREMLLTDGWITGEYLCTSLGPSGDFDAAQRIGRAPGSRCAVGALRAAHKAGSEKVRGSVTPAYEKAATALAIASEGPEFITSELERARANAQEYGDLFDSRTRVDVLEDLIIGYNDSYVDDREGRDEVIAKFDEAIAAL